MASSAKPLLDEVGKNVVPNPLPWRRHSTGAENYFTVAPPSK